MDYTDIGLDSKLRSVDSLSSRRISEPVVKYENPYEVRPSRVNMSKVNLGQFIKRSVGGTALGTFSSSTALNIVSTITYKKPQSQMPTFGKPVVAIYQGAGTNSVNQIYPIRGTAVTLGRYDVIGGEINYASYNGTADQWSAMIVDTNGTSTQAITFAADWIFTDYVTNTVS